ncbi:immunoglobulin lambda-1 light chain-like isoform X1 [Esox lucius]|uniref:immunoglobulin lambda-1 light chain-like isoform X1 n=1 Tax=Esox lucius TaxID=8010 RepID=UPI00147745F8|nr:immunoglobulin lambda-1 light chain-like isoform X1 [Esox lucius]
MLGTLCTLITALTCVSGVVVVTQKPPVVTLRKGEMVTLDCNTGGDGKIAFWYKHVQGGVPRFVLYYHHSYSSVKYGSGFSSPKFTCNHQSQSDYQFIINNVEESDSAVYYCKTLDGSANEYVFGQGTKLIVTDSTLPPPVLTILPPSSDEVKSSKVTLVCLASQMAMGYADVSWTVGGSPVTSNIVTSTAVPQDNKTFQLSSYLTIDTSEWNQDKEFSCKVTVGSKFTEKCIKKSECSNE